MSLTLIFVIVLLLILFLGAMVNPMMGVLGYLTVYLIYSPYGWWTGPLRQYISRPSLIAMIFLFIGCLLHIRKLDWRISRKEITFYLFIGTAWLVSYFFGVEMHRGSFKFLEKMTKMFIFLFFFIRIVHSYERYNIAIWAFILGGIFIGYQAHVGGDFSTGRMESVGGIDFNESNSLASFLILGITLLGYKLLKAPWWGKALFAAAIAIMMDTVILARSRAVFMGVVLAIPYVLLKMPKKFKKQVYFYSLLGVIMAFVLVDPQFIERMGTVDDQLQDQTSGMVFEQEQIPHRLDFWKTSVKIFKNHPMGIGVNNFSNVVVLYDPRNPGMDPHNTYVLCYSEIGIIGISLFMIIILESCFELRRTQQIVKNTEHEEKINIAIISLITVYIINFLGSNMTHSYLYLELTWILFALPICLEKATQNLIATSAPSPETLNEETSKQ